jgi:hypothetical protein
MRVGGVERGRTWGERTAAEYTALLDSAGFTLDRVVASPSRFSFTEAALAKAVTLGKSGAPEDPAATNDLSVCAVQTEILDTLHYMETKHA